MCEIFKLLFNSFFFKEFGEEGSEQVELAQQTLLSEDMRREQLRKKWEQEEEENLAKPQLHYRDVSNL